MGETKEPRKSKARKGKRDEVPSLEGKNESSEVDKRGIRGVLPSHLELQRTRVVLDKDAPIYTQSLQFSGAYMALGVDNSLHLDDLERQLAVEIQAIDGNDMEFDLIGVDPAIANAFRRIMISEVPTMAIERVFIGNNTSIVQDEVLAHRLGLVPLRADPRLFDYQEAEEVATESNCLVYKLHAKCKGHGAAATNARVLSGMLEWLPMGSEWPPNSEKKFTAFQVSQEERFPQLKERRPDPTYNDIVLSKMRAGQEVELEVHAVKGIGRTHAKWSPVATAWYRMMPEVIIKEEMKGQEADALKAVCPVNVFDIEDLGRGERRAVVSRPRDCTLCRECIRDEGWGHKVQLQRIKDHFIFKIESTGALSPDVVFTEAVKILKTKCANLTAELSK